MMGVANKVSIRKGKKNCAKEERQLYKSILNLLQGPLSRRNQCVSALWARIWKHYKKTRWKRISSFALIENKMKYDVVKFVEMKASRNPADHLKMCSSKPSNYIK